MVGSRTYQTWVASKLPRQPEERLLEVVVGLGRDVVVLEVFFPVESDGLGLHLSFLDVNLVAREHDRNVLADTDEITCVLISVDSSLSFVNRAYGAS